MSTTPLPASPAAAKSPATSSASAKRLGTGLPSTPRWANEKLVENPAPRAAIPSRTTRATLSISPRHAGGAPPPRRLPHPPDLVARGGPLVGVVAHHVETQWAVAHVHREVEQRAP